MPKSVKCGFGPDGVVGGNIRLVRTGPTLIVNVGFDPDFKPNVDKFPNLAQVGVPALVDTGAQASFIDDALAIALNLPIVDRQKVSGSNGEHEVNVYLAHVHVPEIGMTQFGRFGGVHLAAGGQSHRALIGRTFLMHFEMHYNGLTGEVELRMPGS